MAAEGLEMAVEAILRVGGERLLNPQAGDYWHDHFAFRMWVVAVSETHVLSATACPPCELPTDLTWVVWSRQDFYQHYTHAGREGRRRPTLDCLGTDLRSAHWLDAAPAELGRGFARVQDGACQVWDGLA